MTGNWLILETSGRVGTVGLARGGAVVRAVSLDDRRRHARDLALTVSTVLDSEGLCPETLSGVVFGRGPGSYTGLRVGLMSAKALAYATGCELRAVETFAAIADQAPPTARDIWVIADALRDQVYAQEYVRRECAWHPVNDLRIESASAWAARLHPGDWVSGPGVAAYVELIGQAVSLAPEADREARVESIFAAGMRVSPLSRTELFALEPLYLRGSSAEEKKTGEPRR
jgi:tRNA threonylcarbamoyladenosine biosynthesis protein TsaB